MNASPVGKGANAPTIVLVDDDRALLNAVTFSLETEGYRVRAFANGESLLSSKEQAADCYVIDEILPGGIRGVELIGRLRATGITAPAILMTTHPGPELKRRAEGLQVPIIEKPLMGSALTRAIQRAIG